MTLFEDGDWRLIDGVWKTISIMHRCNPRPDYDVDILKDMDVRSQDDNWWYYAQKNGVCPHCGEKAPDEMMGLKTLHEWKPL